MIKVAVLDDYQRVARTLADWTLVDARATVEVFHDHLADADAVVARLLDFDVVCVMRERTPLPRAILERLPKLRLIVSTGPRNASIDVEAAKERGIPVLHTGYSSQPTIEMTWALILGVVRHVATENANVRAGRWQQTLGTELRGKTLGLLGLGNIGGEVARIGRAFGMETIAWSQNLTAEKATEQGAVRVEKDELFRRADVLSVHLVLSDRSRGIVGADELALMKSTAYLVNTSRGPLVKEADLVAALQDKRIAGVAVDVYDIEPVPADHPFRSIPNVLATPHIGYVSEEMYRVFYGDTVNNVLGWLGERPTS